MERQTTEEILQEQQKEEFLLLLESSFPPAASVLDGSISPRADPSADQEGLPIMASTPDGISLRMAHETPSYNEQQHLLQNPPPPSHVLLPYPPFSWAAADENGSCAMPTPPASISVGQSRMGAFLTHPFNMNRTGYLAPSLAAPRTGLPHWALVDSQSWLTRQKGVSLPAIFPPSRTAILRGVPSSSHASGSPQESCPEHVFVFPDGAIAPISFQLVGDCIEVDSVPFINHVEIQVFRKNLRSDQDYLVGQVHSLQPNEFTVDIDRPHRRIFLTIREWRARDMQIIDWRNSRYFFIVTVYHQMENAPVAANPVTTPRVVVMARKTYRRHSRRNRSESVPPTSSVAQEEEHGHLHEQLMYPVALGAPSASESSRNDYESNQHDDFTLFDELFNASASEENVHYSPFHYRNRTT